MKLYVQHGQVFFDYTDLEDVNAGLDRKAIDYRRFMRETDYCLSATETPNVASLAYTPWTGATEYGNACELRRLLGLLEVRAKCNNIEVDNSFTALYNATVNRCAELRAIEVEKEQKQQEQAKWQSLCKYGCGNCENLKYACDLPICKCTGKPLEEKNKPEYKFGALQLFNLVPFPSGDCPFSSASKAVTA